MTITKETFNAFREVQFSGATNMWDIKTVCGLSDNLTEKDCLYIMENYKTLEKEYGGGIK